MIRLPKKTLFAIEAVLDIAYHAGSEPVESREITRRQCIPRRYLEQALQQLVRDGILIGVRGPKGGYRLARERRRITIAEIVASMRKTETAEDPLECPEGSDLGHNVVRPIWGKVQDMIMEQLGGITIHDMCAKAHDSGIESEGRQNLDFSI